MRILGLTAKKPGSTKWVASSVLFNHESPRRGETFVTRKITRGLARVDAGLGVCRGLSSLPTGDTRWFSQTDAVH